MINWEKELEKIFEDPLLADVMPPKKRVTSSDRLIAGFQKIMDFYESNGRLPQETPDESSLYHNWRGILKREKKIERCRPYDEYGLLPVQDDIVEEPTIEYKREFTKEDRLEAILNDPLFADTEYDADLGLFDVPEYMRERLKARKEAEYVGSRRPCADFEKYSDDFAEIHQGLNSGKYKLVRFRESMLKQGSYFVEQGIIGYLAAFESEKKNKRDREDGRTRVIYENGSEADIKFRTITKNLSVDGYGIINCSEISDEELERHFSVNDHDIESGTIYVLRSKSLRPEIAAIKNLYKIGFTSTSIESRIANAKNEPTYLCADVEVIATWKVYNVKSSTFEAIIHKLFASVQLQILVDGRRPKEWFVVPFKIIEESINAIIVGRSIEYNPQLQQIIYL